jgi:uncharacterized Zn-finger protein
MNEEIVCPGSECPSCGENRVDYLVWINDEEIECQTCKNMYKL